MMKPYCCHHVLMVIEMLVVIGLFACSRPQQDLMPTVATTSPAITASTGESQTATPSLTATPTPAPTITPRPTPCGLAIQPALTGAWNLEELGCPITPGASAISTAYAPFEGGQMLWRSDIDIIYILYNDGRWESYPNEWREGDPEYSCGETNDPARPVRGFGRVWCVHPDVREALGRVTAAETGDNASAVQDFVNGTILLAPFGSPFVLVGEDGVWRRIEERS